MRLRELYLKDIGRHIEGVIKADDESNIINEVEEYIITAELEEKLDHFFGVYASSIGTRAATSEIGVWISGFFGSGKSHLLKMLSYVLENRLIDGRRAGEIFLEKVAKSDFELRRNIEKALSIPTRTILFNIDQKTDKTSKTQEDAVLAVFMKVFNEMSGYYPKFGFVAEFERDLDQQGLYARFKEKYREIAGEPWERGRETIFLEIENFAKALAAVKNISEADAAKVIEQYETRYALSIEDFAKKVKSYIDQQGKEFRLIFCVDEMGQYIADNTRLTLDLQTIAESLSTICKGQAWIMVTSQEEMDLITGEMKDKQANDFSRIQARFATRINLSSKNVDEVIQKRLLAKNEAGEKILKSLYEKETSNFKTYFHFEEGRQYKNFRDEAHFIYTYPFVPYQFDLFQSSRRGLSRHNAFQGRHQSVGERSMLDVCQEVARGLADAEPGQLVSFDRLFDGQKATLKSEIQSSITNAEKNLDHPLDVKVLKALFLVKYVKEFKATCKNITTLMFDHFGADLLKLEKQVQESLNRLESQTYVQQVAGVYEFLTDEEKDVENEIKATEVDTETVRKLLAEVLFKQIIQDNRIRFEDNKQDYDFAKKADNRTFSREEDMAIHFITPLFEENAGEAALKAASMGRRELIIKLPDDARLRQELTLYKKTEKYVLQTQSSVLPESVRNILAAKGSQNSERGRNLIQHVKDLIVESSIYLNGSVLEASSGNPLSKINSAFQHLIKLTYPNLQILKAVFKEEDIKAVILQQDSDLFGGAGMSEAEQEMLSYFQRKQNANERVTTKKLLEDFSGRPWGWYQAAILCIVARLFIRNKVEISYESQPVQRKDLLNLLRNSREFANTIIEAARDIEAGKIKKLKDFYREFFNETLAESEPKAVSEKVRQRLEREEQELAGWLQQQPQYPFLKALETPLGKLRELLKKDPYFLFEHVEEFGGGLLDAKEDLLDPLKRFMNGEQRKIYDAVQHFLAREAANLTYLEAGGVEQLKNLSQHPAPYRGNIIKESKTVLEALQTALQEQVAREREEVEKTLQETRERLQKFEDYQKLKPEQQTALLGIFEAEGQKLSRQTFIPVLRETALRIQNSLYQSALSQMDAWLAKDGGGQPVKEIVPIRRLQPAIYQATLDSEAEVETYIQMLREKLLEVIRNNKKISL
ncbi:MAG: BREX system P-loop protein BrxC [Calditrichaceae bacterium]|nr:BREX system P-loop protein BrxC [Calditrichia bacterium]NUQ44273.1 BREX system P-loop protein BrxC [Calditrichaceae bacterium]